MNFKIKLVDIKTIFNLSKYTANHSFKNNRVELLDNFFQSDSLHHIDYIKTDTHGYHLNVLQGSSQPLMQHSDNFMEIGVNKENTAHIAFPSVNYLEKFNNKQQSIYKQTLE